MFLSARPPAQLESSRWLTKAEVGIAAIGLLAAPDTSFILGASESTLSLKLGSTNIYIFWRLLLKGCKHYLPNSYLLSLHL